MGANMMNVTHQNPCVICGKPDWCFRKDYGTEGILHYCARVKQEAVLSGGSEYIFKRETKDHFYAYEDKNQYERNLAAFIEKQKLLHPERDYSRLTGRTFSSNLAEPVVQKKLEEEPMVKPLPPEKLDAIYRSFLSMLVLEDKHRKILDEEWGNEPGLMDKILSTYPIVSIPPEDRIRFSKKERLANPSRKKICETLVSQFGSLRGVPGFYQKKGCDIWTFCELSGIAFPVIDHHGRIIRIRVKDDCPAVEAAFNGQAGKYYYYDGEWHWKSEDGNGFTVTQEMFYSIPTKHGIPVGKVSGKYKNFSSYKKTVMGDKICNRYSHGCQSGSYCSLYVKDGDDWSTVIFTEGEKKAIVANILIGHPVVSIPGVNCYSKLFRVEEGYSESIISYLTMKGMKVAVIAYDADKATNEKVLRSEAGATQEMLQSGVMVAIGEWNANWGKGLDDILLQGIMPDLHFVK